MISFNIALRRYRRKKTFCILIKNHRVWKLLINCFEFEWSDVLKAYFVWKFRTAKSSKPLSFFWCCHRYLYKTWRWLLSQFRTETKAFILTVRQQYVFQRFFNNIRAGARSVKITSLPVMFRSYINQKVTNLHGRVIPLRSWLCNVVILLHSLLWVSKGY